MEQNTPAVVKSKHCDKGEMTLKTCTSAAFFYLGFKAEFYSEDVYLCLIVKQLVFAL